MTPEISDPSADELIYLADQQRHARGMMREDDSGGIRESLVIEWALRSAHRSSELSREGVPAVEVRRNPDETIDEICIDGGNVHIEQMSNDGWFMGVEAKDGSYWQFWFGAKNRKSHVEFRHTETVPAKENAKVQAPRRRPSDCAEPLSCGWQRIQTNPDIGLYSCSNPACPHIAKACSTAPVSGSTEGGK